MRKANLMLRGRREKPCFMLSARWARVKDMFLVGDCGAKMEGRELAKAQKD